MVGSAANFFLLNLTTPPPLTSEKEQPVRFFFKSYKNLPELQTLEWWILRSMLDPLLFLISRLT